MRNVWPVLAASIVAVSVSTFPLIQSVVRDEFDPFGGFPVPQKIIGPRTVSPGGTVVVRGTKCYRQAVTTTGRAVFVRLAPSTIQLPFSSGIRARKPGCVTSTFANVLPAVMPAGVWRAEGQDCATRGRDTVCQGWWTQTFTVKEPA